VYIAAAEPTSGQHGGMATVLVIVLLIALGLSALLIVGLVRWTRTQEHTRDMMRFCMKFLLHSENEAERCASARSLGHTNDPGAILVLVDVMWDEEEAEPVRKAAGEALHQMSGRLRKHDTIISDLESELEKRNYQGIIDILVENFERGRAKYVQSAYLIGRQYMRLDHYFDAREWLAKAEARNQKFNLYGNRIKVRIQECNAFLLDEADDSFKAGDYQQAKEHYAALDHGLSDAEKQRCAVYLRSACVYCKLADYRNADQAVLAALRFNHDAELALTLPPLLQQVLMPEGKDTATDEHQERIKSQIDARATAIMSELMVRDTWHQSG
jgi:tetratricopeptide (TPR) repeat protein